MSNVEGKNALRITITQNYHKCGNRYRAIPYYHVFNNIIFTGIAIGRYLIRSRITCLPT